jgi:hypothetical protein
MDILYGLALSMHLGFEGDYNSVHPHVRLQNEEVVAGVYYNSENTLSLYGGMVYEKGNWNHEFGIVSGYSSATVQPFVRSTYDISDTVKGFVAPAIENHDGDEIFGIVFGIEIWSQ